MTDNQSEILVARRDGVLAITLNRPAGANAINADMRETLVQSLATADIDHDIRAVLIRGEGKHFCAGADVAGIKAGAPRVGDAMKRIMNSTPRIIAAILDCSKPVVSCVHGSAVGVGAHIAFASDMTIAAEDAKFCEIFVRRGITLDAGGAWLLPRLVGLQKAKELVFLGDMISGADAAAMGLVNRAVPRDELVETAQEFTNRLAQGPTTAISFAKRQLNKSFESDRAAAFYDEAIAQEMTSRTDDAKEGVTAFIEKRAPQFKGS